MIGLAAAAAHHSPSVTGTVANKVAGKAAAAGTEARIEVRFDMAVSTVSGSQAATIFVPCTVGSSRQAVRRSTFLVAASLDRLAASSMDMIVEDTASSQSEVRSVDSRALMAATFDRCLSFEHIEVVSLAGSAADTGAGRSLAIADQQRVTVDTVTEFDCSIADCRRKAYSFELVADCPMVGQ